jgi:hypothetical protein
VCVRVCVRVCVLCVCMYICVSVCVRYVLCCVFLFSVQGKGETWVLIEVNGGSIKNCLLGLLLS